ncbi:MAG: hypothetical protein K1060chlam3_00991, partial [Candidatus Anoxychlamydiales bacterium]|nr:hypothetical protein [Candidatus Anoxychlamydiales bacterium]
SLGDGAAIISSSLFVPISILAGFEGVRL